MSRIEKLYMALVAGVIAAAAVAGIAFATGPSTVLFPNSTPYGVTFDAGGAYHSTTAIVDINNPSNGVALGQQTMSASLPVALASNQSNVPVNCVSGCSGGGGASQVDEATFTQGTTSLTPVGGIYLTSGLQNLANGQVGVAQLTVDRMLFTNLGKVGGSAIALGQTTMSASLPVALASNESTLPINANGNMGQQTMANSLPVVIASNQGGLPVFPSVSCTPYHLAGGTAASTNSTSVATGAHTICSVKLINTTSTLAYFRLYDNNGAPTCSSATNLKHTYPIPQGNGAGAGLIIPEPFGEVISNGIGYCVTGGGSDTDVTNTVVGIYIEIDYK